MPNVVENKQVKHLKLSLWLPIGLVILFVVALAGLAVYHQVWANTIFPKVNFGKIFLGGLSKEEAEQVLNKAWDGFSKKGVTVTYSGKDVTIMPLVSSPTDPDLTYEMVDFKTAQVVDLAWSVGRRGNWFVRLVEPLAIRLRPLNIASLEAITVETDRVVEFLHNNFIDLEKPTVSANWQVETDGNLTIAPEQSGSMIDDVKLTNDLQKAFLLMSDDKIDLSFKPSQPDLTVEDLKPLLAQANQLLKNDNFVFSFDQEKFIAEPQVWHKWLAAVKMADQIKIVLQPDTQDEFWLNIAKNINQPALDAKFEIVDGRVKAFQAAQTGQALDLEKTLNQATELLLANAKLNLELSVKETKPKISTADTNGLGIAELIGVGRSNFAGSPKNRRHNIKTGADSLNGLLIQPGEEFSLIAALGNIDGDNGYLPELVIKGNKTIPEYGGGLCQIGTTTFRAALASGLPIVERRNHSYRVQYYEPAGTDATIYDPKPDFRFTNDTAKVVLIQTKIKGDELIFEFWGTQDGRQAVSTPPRIYNIVKPPPTKIVETEDLPVGQKKCTESAHNGADAEFTYTVTYPDNRVEEQVFKSHYVPWQEVCLVGVPKGSLSTNQPDTTSQSSSTDSLDQTSDNPLPSSN